MNTKKHSRILWAGICLLAINLTTAPVSAGPGDLRTGFTLSWASSNDANTGARIYVRTSLPAGMPAARDAAPNISSFVPQSPPAADAAAWTLLGEVPAGGGNSYSVLTANLPGWSTGYRGPYFFVVTAFNFMGESDFSNVAWTPSPPLRDGTLTIGATPAP